MCKFWFVNVFAKQYEKSKIEKILSEKKVEVITKIIIGHIFQQKVKISLSDKIKTWKVIFKKDV